MAISIERLTAEDALMLWPDEVWPQDIGALVYLDGSDLLDAAGRFQIKAARKVIESRLHLVPRFRQLLLVPPRRLGGPYWVDTTDFRIEDHLGVRPVPPPGDEAQLLLTVEGLRRRRLDRSRPLWEMWFLTGLADGRVALFARMHHCIADGMAGVATIAAFLDLDPDTVPAPPEPWTPGPAPTPDELLNDHRTRRRRELRQGVSGLAHPVRRVRNLLAAWPALRELLADEPLPSTSIDRVVGADRTLALVRSRLDPIKEVAHRHGATVNDVLLAAVAGGMRHLFAARGEPVEGVLRIFVPVSLHQGPHAEARGNLIGQMIVPLPIGVADPSQRLRDIAAETRQRKAEARPSLGKMPHRGIVGRVFLRLIDRQRVNLTSADIPGPEMPLYFAGARLLEVFPMVQLLAKDSLAVGAMSYAGEFNLMVVADRDTYPDLDTFVAGISEDLEVLAAPVRGPGPGVLALPERPEQRVAVSARGSDGGAPCPPH